MNKFKKPLQGQHYKMAAIIAKGWAYEEEIKEGEKEKKGRLKSVCQFNTEKLFEYTTTEKTQNKKKYYDYMKVKKNKAKKIDKCVPPAPEIGGGANVVIKNLFTSHLIRQETEKILKVKLIEERFLNYLNISDNLKNKILLTKKRNIKIVKDYIALQYIRNPLFYRFLIDSYLNNKIMQMDENIINNIYKQNDPILFSELTILDDKKLKELIEIFAILKFLIYISIIEKI